jgi:multidrug efflux pump subunit AcrA (membrane-fusion protein)
MSGVMNFVRKLIGWIVPLLILGAASAAFIWLGSQKPPARRVPEAPSAVAVRTTPLQHMDRRIEIDVDGVVVPLREVTLAAEVPGRIRRKSEACRAGQSVKAGDVLFEIDPRDYQLEVQRLEGEVRQAALNIEEIDEELAQNVISTDLSRRQVDLARREVSRLDSLKANRIITETEHERALRDELTAINSLTILQGQKRVLSKRQSRLAEARALAATMLERASLDLSRTQVVAPIDGVVVDDKVEQDSFVAKGTPLVMLEDTSALEVKTSLRMDELSQVWGGQPAGVDTLGAHDLPDVPARVVFTLGGRSYEWDGILSRQEGRGLDEKTRTLPCRVLVKKPANVKAIDRYGATMAGLPPEAPRSLLRGMFVDVLLQVDVPQSLVAVPQEAVRPSGEMFVMRDGILVIVRARPFHSSGGLIAFAEQESGLLPTDRIVTSQLSNPREGMPLVEANP